MRRTAGAAPFHVPDASPHARYGRDKRHTPVMESVMMQNPNPPVPGEVPNPGRDPTPDRPSDPIPDRPTDPTIPPIRDPDSEPDEPGRGPEDPTPDPPPPERRA
ncbi:hypothetical protein [Luteimonas suaedae]|uniref:hypothetical protein n=1 Tax=Luteimonas suaedae TaxID=2605430 RepID=UPI0011F050D3|nr:hypothetical protein [Luteimonas suaedae]